VGSVIYIIVNCEHVLVNVSLHVERSEKQVNMYNGET